MQFTKDTEKIRVVEDKIRHILDHSLFSFTARNHPCDVAVRAPLPGNVAREGHVCHRVWCIRAGNGGNSPTVCEWHGTFVESKPEPDRQDRRSVHNSYGLPMVVVAVVSEEHFDIFNHAFRTVRADLKTHERHRVFLCRPDATVVVTLHGSNLVIADRLARSGLNVGLLNPSDPLALQAGYLGMFFVRRDSHHSVPPVFDNGNIALEEFIALQTTLLLHHKGANPDLYKPGRYIYRST